MPIISAENKFKKGLEALIDQNYVEAATHFRRAMDIEYQRRVPQPDMRYLSYYTPCRNFCRCSLSEMYTNHEQWTIMNLKLDNNRLNVHF